MLRFAPSLLGILAIATLANVIWSGRSPNPSHFTAAEDFTFVQLCDTQIGFGDFENDVRNMRQAVRHINELDVDFVLLCGDMIHRPADTASVDAFKEEIAKLEVPCHLVPGNHDLLHGNPTQGLQNYREVFGKDYYRVDHNGLRLLVLNTSLWILDLPAEQSHHDAWLRRELKQAEEDGVPLIAAGHYPFFALHPLEPWNKGNVPKEHRQRWLDNFADRGVRAYLSGHAHADFTRQYRGVDLVTTGSTSFNFDGSPIAFRLWHIGADGTFENSLVNVEGARPPENDAQLRAGVYKRNLKRAIKYVFPFGEAP